MSGFSRRSKEISDGGPGSRPSTVVRRMMSEGRGNVTGRQAWGLLPQVCVFYFVSYVAPLMTRGTNIDYRWNSFIVVCFRLLYDYTVPIDWLLDFNAFKGAPVLLVDGVTPRFNMAEAKFSHYYHYRLLNVTKDFFLRTRRLQKKTFGVQETGWTQRGFM